MHASGAGFPSAEARELRVGRALALVASITFLLVGVWEIAASFGAGHFATSTAVTLAGENMLRFRTVLPLTELPLRPPTWADADTQHPFGIFWTASLFVGLFGHHDFVCRLPPLLFSALTPPLLYGLGRALWGPLAGALSALAFVLTPIALSHAQFNAPEVPVLFSTLLASFAYVRLRQSGQQRFAVLSVLAVVHALNSDWPAYAFTAGLLLLIFLRVFAGGRALSNAEFRRLSSLFAWLVMTAATVALSYGVALAHMDRLEELLAQGKARSLGEDPGLPALLAARRYWAVLMLTPLAIPIGKLAVPVIALRALLRRDEREAIPLALLGMALFQYLVVSERADRHGVWPHYFALYFALALGSLARTATELVTGLATRLALASSDTARSSGVLACALGFLVPVLMARDALTTLVYTRKLGGRFSERSRFIQPDKDKVAAFTFLATRLKKDATVVLSPNIQRSPGVPWALERATRTGRADTLRRGERYFMTDGRFSSSESLLQSSRRGSVTVLGPFWLFDRQGKPGPVQGYSLLRKQPDFFERLFVSSTHALRQVRVDPYWTWELRNHLRQSPNPEPSAPPQTREELRIAHNIAISRGDPSRAQRLRARLLQGADPSAATEYEDGTRLLATRFERGASDVLSVYFESVGAAEQRFRIRSRVEAPPAGSLVPADAVEWEVGLPTQLQRDIWRPGYLYVSVTEILKRPGRERFEGSWINTGQELPLKAKDGADDVTLLVLP